MSRFLLIAEDHHGVSNYGNQAVESMMQVFATA